jgi:signal transduction histidine kinase
LTARQRPTGDRTPKTSAAAQDPAGNSTYAADVAHQLRTQLQLLRLRLEHLALHLPPGGRTVHTRIMADMERLTSTLTELLDASAAPGQAPPLVRIDVCPVVRDRVEAWMDAATSKGLVLTPASPSQGVILARRGTLDQILDVFLDNAVRSSPPCTEITVSIQVEPDDVTVHVVDQGPGMTAEERASATERGWQGDSGHADGAGQGLGLSIAYALTAASGGRLGLGPGPRGRGLDAHVRFPRLDGH